MKIIDLDKVESPDIFLLWENEYKYQFDEIDRKYYLDNIKKLDYKKNNHNELKNIFETILKKQNIFINISDSDVEWLFNYFNYKFL